MTKSMKFCLLTILSFFCKTGFAVDKPMILELKDVAGYSISEEIINEQIYLTISGLAFHSSLAVKEIQKRVENHKMIVQISLFLARQGTSGRFKETFMVPDEINEVVFGTQEKEIWHRK